MAAAGEFCGAAFALRNFAPSLTRSSSFPVQSQPTHGRFMAQRRWTLVISPPGSGASKVLEVSTRALKVAGGASLVFGLVALLLGYSTFSRTIHLSHADAVERENATLSTEIAQLGGRIDSLADTLDAIAIRDSRIRLLANLEPIDPQV